MGKGSVVVYIGISLDGFIATREDSLDWLLNTQGCGDNGFGEFYATVDTVIMGRRTYDWIMEQEQGCFPYPGKECYVYTTKNQSNTSHVIFTARKPEELISALKAAGKRVWIVGGSQIIDLFRKEDLIDQYILNISPVILGDGIPLFRKGREKALVLDAARTFGQFAELRYHTKEKE